MMAIAAILALALGYRTARARFSPMTSGLATLAIAAGSPLLWQALGAEDWGTAARLLAGTTAAYVWITLSRGQPDRARWPWALAGLVAGLACAAPWLDGPWTLVDFSVADVWWSARAGLFATSPTLYLAALGLAALWRLDRVLSTTGLLVLAATSVLVAAHAGWWTHANPSPAAFAAAMPYFLLGTAAFIDTVGHLVARQPTATAGVVLGSLVLWNVTLMSVAHEGGFRIGEPVSFGEVGAAQTRALHDWVGHTSSMPANLAYAVTNGVPPGRYDIFRPARFLAGTASSATIDVGGDDGLYVDTGWHAPERDGDTSFRWATRRAALVVPLDHAAALDVDVMLRPFDVPDGAPQTLTLVVNAVSQAPVSLEGGWHTVRVRVPVTSWRAGVNHVELRFARDTRPLDLGARDDRPLAAAIDRVTIAYFNPAR